MRNQDSNPKSIAIDSGIASFTEASETEQQRNHYRVPTDLAGAVLTHPTSTRRHSVVLNDLSVGGLHLTSLKRFKLGKRISIQFDIGACGEPIEVVAHGLVVRASRDAETETFLLGVHFTHLASEAKHRLGRYVMQEQLSQIARSPDEDLWPRTILNSD